MLRGSNAIGALLLGLALLATGCVSAPAGGPGDRIDLAMLGPADDPAPHGRSQPIVLGAGDALGESVMSYYVFYVHTHGEPLPWLAVELDAYRD